MNETAKRWAREETRLLVVLGANTLPLREIMRRMGSVDGRDTWRAIERLTAAELLIPLGVNPRDDNCLYVRRFPTDEMKRRLHDRHEREAELYARLAQ
jgi:hypothetical protein